MLKRSIVLIFFLCIHVSVQGRANSFLYKLWGAPSPNSLCFGMWSYHFYVDQSALYRNDLLLLVYNNFVLGTLINCYDDRCYLFGIQRDVLITHFGCDVNGRLGYRAGFVYGYDERLMPIAGTLKLLPCIQFLYDIHWKHIGIEFSATGLIVSVGLNYRF